MEIGCRFLYETADEMCTGSVSVHVFQDNMVQAKYTRSLLACFFVSRYNRFKLGSIGAWQGEPVLEDCMDKEKGGVVSLQEIAGLRFGHLVAVRNTERKSKDGSDYWICMCDCGATTAASYRALMDGTAVSCGCTKLIGRQYGWLTVVDAGKSLRCRCICGKEITLARSELQVKRSCGCDSRERAELDGQVSIFPKWNAMPLEI